jgi:hypothetical protein
MLFEVFELLILILILILIPIAVAHETILPAQFACDVE